MANRCMDSLWFWESPWAHMCRGVHTQKIDLDLADGTNRYDFWMIGRGPLLANGKNPVKPCTGFCFSKPRPLNRPLPVHGYLSTEA